MISESGMIVLIAESKTMSAGHDVSADSYMRHIPVLAYEADAIMRSLVSMPVSDLAGAVKISLAMARRLQQMIIGFGDKTYGSEAIDAYTGVVFSALDYRSLSDDARAELRSRVRIISSLYGWLRPDDIIRPYRFDFTTRLAPGQQSFAAYWRDAVTGCLLDEIGRTGCSTVLDLLPGDASRCIEWPRVAAVADVYKADFVEVQPGGILKTPSSNRLKTLRGELVRQIVTDNISDIGVLGSLVGDSYMAEVSMHTPGHIVFATAR